MPGYREYVHWSPTLGCSAARISMFDRRGDEYFRIIPHVVGKSYRLARETTIDLILEAMDRGAAPGEV